MGRKSNHFNLQPAGGVRCWGSTALAGHNATRKYWWSFRGIHVDPNAPFTNKELMKLRNIMLNGNFSWTHGGSGDAAAGGNATDGGSDRGGKHASSSSSGGKDGTDSEKDPYADLENWTDWIKVATPPGPDLDGVTSELIDSQVTGEAESSVASFSIMTMFFLLGEGK